MQSDKSRTISYPADDAQRLEADLCQNLGTMHVSGGTHKLVDAEFICSIDGWQPDVEYSVNDGIGYLSMLQSGGDHKAWKRWRATNDWQVQFGDSTPLGLNVELNAATADLQLSKLNMHGLDVELNSGTADIVLTGSHPLLTRADIEGNAGKVKLVMYGSFPELEFIDVELNATKAELDLSGEWHHDVNISVESQASMVLLKLPRSIGVKVYLDSALAMVRSDELMRKGNALYNDAYQTSDVKLTLDITANVGKFDIRLVDKIAVV